MPKTHYNDMTTRINTIPDRPLTGLPRYAPSTTRDEGEKYATGTRQDNIPSKSREEATLPLDHGMLGHYMQWERWKNWKNEMERCHWNILGLSETRLKNQGETTNNEGHRFYYSGKDDKHEHGVGFLIHKDTVHTVMGCRPVSCRVITIRIRASPFNITTIQAYAPTSDYDDTIIETFYEQLHEVIYFLTNTFGPYKPSRRWTLHSPNGKTHNQIDYIMVKKRLRSSVNINRTRSFPGADIGSDHELLMLTFRLRLKRIIKPTNTQIKYDLEKLKDPTVAKAFQAKIGGKFAPLILLENENNYIDTMITAINTAVTETANEILGKHRRIKKPWVTLDILDLCDKRRELKKKKGDTDGREIYKKVNTEIRSIMKKAKEKWIKKQCVSIENNLKNNNTNMAYQTVK